MSTMDEAGSGKSDSNRHRGVQGPGTRIHVYARIGIVTQLV